jgi:hypothetical protein
LLNLDLRAQFTALLRGLVDETLKLVQARAGKIADRGALDLDRPIGELRLGRIGRDVWLRRVLARLRRRALAPR